LLECVHQPPTDMTIPESPSSRDLKSLFCKRFKCPPSEFGKRALRKCLYLHARIIAPLLDWLNPSCFERDRVFIDYFGKATTQKEVTAEREALKYQDHTEPRFARRALRIRISSRKAGKLAAKLFLT
jgi:hypothetical protein